MLFRSVSESGKVSNTTLSVDVGYSDEMLDLLSKSLTYNYRGKTVDQALKIDIISSFESNIEVMSKLAENIMPNFLKTAVVQIGTDDPVLGQSEAVAGVGLRDVAGGGVGEMHGSRITDKVQDGVPVAARIGGREIGRASCRERV